MHETTKKIKVIHVVDSLETGGLENGIVNICNRLDRTRFDPMICCTRGIGPMANRLKPDVLVANMNFPEGKAPLRPLVMARFFRKEKPDLVHTHGFAGGFYEGVIGARLAGGITTINGEHGALWLKLHQVYIQRIITTLCNTILSVSETLKIELVKKLGILPAKIKVIPNGVDVQTFTGNYDMAEIKQELFNKLGVVINKDTLVLGCIGSLKPAKNQKMLINAIKKVSKNNKNNNLMVLFIGDGPDRIGLERDVIDAGLNNRIFFLGEQRNIAKLLSIINVLVSTSIPEWEGMSNVILEGMSSGVPVIATRSVGTSELVINGVNGFLIEPYNIGDLCNKIQSFQNNPNLYKQLGLNARQIVCEKYSIEKMVSSYEAVYINSLESGIADH